MNVGTEVNWFQSFRWWPVGQQFGAIPVSLSRCPGRAPSPLNPDGSCRLILSHGRGIHHAGSSSKPCPIQEQQCQGPVGADTPMWQSRVSSGAGEVLPRVTQSLPKGLCSVAEGQSVRSESPKSLATSTKRLTRGFVFKVENQESSNRSEQTQWLQGLALCEAALYIADSAHVSLAWYSLFSVTCRTSGLCRFAFHPQGCSDQQVLFCARKQSVCPSSRSPLTSTNALFSFQVQEEGKKVDFISHNAQNAKRTQLRRSRSMQSLAEVLEQKRKEQDEYNAKQKGHLPR